MQIITETISNLIQRRNQTVETRSTPQYEKISSGFYVSVNKRGISIFKEPLWRLKKRDSFMRMQRHRALDDAKLATMIWLEMRKCEREKIGPVFSNIATYYSFD